MAATFERRLTKAPPTKQEASRGPWGTLWTPPGYLIRRSLTNLEITQNHREGFADAMSEARDWECESALLQQATIYMLRDLSTPEKSGGRPPVGLAQNPLRYDQQQPRSMTCRSRPHRQQTPRLPRLKTS